MTQGFFLIYLNILGIIFANIIYSEKYHTYKLNWNVIELKTFSEGFHKADTACLSFIDMHHKSIAVAFFHSMSLWIKLEFL